MRRLLNAATALTLFMTAGEILADQACVPKETFASCISQLYQQICTASSDPGQCSNDWRIQWMTLQSYCTTEPKKSEQVCKTFASYPASQLLFHHGERRPHWEAVGIMKRTSFDLNGIPTVSVGGRDHLIVAVDKTNPLLYTLVVDEATSEKISQFAQLQTLAGLLGGNLAQLVQGAAIKALPLAGSIEGELDAVSRPMLTASTTVSCLLTAADARSRQATGFVQAVESQEDAEYPLDVTLVPQNCANVKLTATSATAAVGELDRALAILSQLNCSGVVDLEAALSGDPDKFDDILKAYAKFDQEARRCDFWTAPMPGGKVSRLGLLRHDLAGVLAAKDAASMKAALQDALVIKDLDAVHRAAMALAKTQDFAKLAELPKDVAALENFDRTLRRATVGHPQPCTVMQGTQCVAAQNIAAFIVVDGVNGDDVSWQDLETQPFKIAAGDFASNVHPFRQTSITTSYKVQRASARAWDVGVGLVRTRVADPKFTAIDEPAAAMSATTNDTAAQKKIAQTSETTRSGELALFVNLRPVAFFAPDAPAWTRAFGAEIGSAVSTDKPAVFGGVSLQLGRFFRLGWGYTAQRVTELKGQTIGTPVTSNDDIKTRQGFHNGHYASLTISLGNIPFFSSSK